MLAASMGSGMLGVTICVSSGGVFCFSGAFRTAFPPLSDVPKHVLTWAEETARQLTPAETDYLSAMFVVVAHPWSAYTEEELKAFDRMLDAGGQLEATMDEAFTSAYESGDTDGLYTLVRGHLKTDGSRTSALVPELADIPSALLSSSRKYGEGRKRESQGKPSSAKVAKLLGIHRFQATRLWTGEKSATPKEL